MIRDGPELALPQWRKGKYDRSGARIARERGDIRVLVVDDDDDVAEALAMLLHDHSFDVCAWAVSGRQAIEAARVHHPHVVVMDVRMPEVDGIQATEDIRDEIPEIQVVMLSAYDDDALRREARRAGAFRYLPKGTSSDEIVRAVTDAAVEAQRASKASRHFGATR